MDLYHVLNRGVEKRNIVSNDDDRMRFVRGLYVFNDKENAPNSVSQPKQRGSDKERDLLVNLHAWCLMNNHYHLLVSPIGDDLKNLSLFMKKVNMGYAKFFNEKYERSGYLWQGNYKKVQISNDAQFQYIPYYIHLNPLDFNYHQWREGSVSQTEFADAKKYLINYRWSSFQDYNNVKNFPSLLHKNLFSKILSSEDNQNRQIRNIISSNNAVHIDKEFTKKLE